MLRYSQTTTVRSYPNDDQQYAAPFEHEEEFPQPMNMDILDQDEWNEEHCSFTDDDDEDDNYDATSISTEPDCVLEQGSLQGSPIFKSHEGKSVVVEPKSPPGIPVTFDDESFIV